MKLLIADDDEAIRRLLAAELRSLGHETSEVQDGAEAVERALADRPEAVFLDVLMPRLNGYDALAKLRAQGYAGKVVIVTALTDSTARRLQAGVEPDATLAKPFRRPDVRRVLEKLGP